jgi:hypothetical protein
MKLQYGVGYYSPDDCNHQDIPCTYNPYPEFDSLADKFAAIDASFVPSFDAFTPPSLLIPDCPAGIAAVGDFEWPSDLELDFACPVFPTGSSASPSVCISACDSAAPSEFPSQAPSISPTTSQIPSSVSDGTTMGSSNSSSAWMMSISIFFSVLLLVGVCQEL